MGLLGQIIGSNPAGWEFPSGLVKESPKVTLIPVKEL